MLALPNELLHKIFVHSGLPTREVLRMALVCRRLQDLCTRIYINLAGIHSPENECRIVLHEANAIGSPALVLQALSLAPSVTKVETLCCTFPRGVREPEQELMHIQNLERFVRSLKYVSTVTLNFHSNWQWDHPPRDNFLNRMSPAFSDLLNVVIERGCTFLSLTAPGDLCGIYLAADIRKPSRWKSFKQLLPRWPGSHSKETVLSRPHSKFIRWPSGRKDVLVRLSSAARTSTVLKHITIASECLLDPPLLQWTRDILEASPIDSITFDCFDFSDYRLGPRWSHLQSILAEGFSKVSTVSFGEFQGRLGADFHSLLAYFPRITSLSFQDFPNSDGYLSRTPPLPEFRHLTHLRANVTWILMTQVVIVHDIPTLRSLTAVWPRYQDTRADVELIQRVLSRLSDRLIGDDTGTPSASLEVTLEIIHKVAARIRLEDVDELVDNFPDIKHEARCVSHLVISHPAGAWVTARELERAAQVYLDNFCEMRSFSMTVKTQDRTDVGLSLGTPFLNAVRASNHRKLEWFEFNGLREQVENRSLQA